MTNDGSGLAARIDVIEGGYEYLLAYAAQGRQDDRGTDARPRLVAMYEALGGLAMEARAALGKGSPYEIGAFLDALERDAATARGAIGLVLRKPAIPSLLVDNLNASVHLRALLTDAFLIEQALRPAAPLPASAAAQ